MVEIVTFNRDLIPFQSIGFNINFRNRSGGASLTGREQIVSSGAALWTAHGTARIRTPMMVREWRRMLWALEGRANVLLVGPCDCRNSGHVSPSDILYVPHDDNTPFDDNTFYSQGGLPPKVVGTSLAGTNTIDVYPLSAMNVLPGTFIGFGGIRMYGIVGVTQIDLGPPNGMVTRVTVKPRLRETVTSASTVQLCDARTKMRLTEDSMGALELTLNRFGDVELDLIEYYEGF